MDNRKPTICVFIDLAKAFDTVSHDILLNTLHNIGFRGNSFDLVRSYLDDRCMCLRTDSNFSRFWPVRYGVPQGTTILGPTLLTLYINELFNLPTAGDIFSFADDTPIEGDTWDNLRKTIEQELDTFVDFFNGKLLTINVNKTSFVPFTSYSSNLPVYSHLLIKTSNGTMQIEVKNCAKYLGILLDSHLRWNKQSEHVTKKSEMFSL